MNNSQWAIALLLLLIVVFAWRYLLGIGVLALSCLMWVLLFRFCSQAFKKIREFCAAIEAEQSKAS